MENVGKSCDFNKLQCLGPPAGVDAGSRVRVSARGNAGLGGGPAGDLYVVTRVGSHPFLTRDGDHLLLRAPITIPEAVLGTDLSVPTLDGTAVIKLPPGTQSGQRFRLRGKGIVSLKTGAPGDEIVEVQVVVPKLEDERSRELIRELERLHPEDPRKDYFGTRR